MPSSKNQQLNADINTLEQLPVAVALIDNEKVYYLNKKAKLLFKLSKDQNLNKLNIFKFLHKDYHKRIKENNIKILKGAVFPAIELGFKDIKGKDLFLEINSNLSYFEGKKVVQSTFTEITERKTTENQLKDVKEKFELITNNSNDIICFFTYYPKEKYLYVSPNIKKILGYKPEELIKDHNFFNKRVIENTKDFLKIDGLISGLQKKNTIKNHHYIFKTTKKNKEEVWLENNLEPITDSRGKIIFYLNVIRDITYQKEKELELQTQYVNYQNLLDGSKIAYVIHHQGIITYCNKELLKILKLTDKKQVLGKFAMDFFSMEDRKRLLNRLKELFQAKKQNQPNNYHLIDSAGNKIEVEIRSSLIKFNNTVCALSSVLNLSEQRSEERIRLKAELTEQNNKLLQKEILEKEKTQQKLIQKTGRLTSIVENTSHLIWTVNKNRELLSFNKNYADVVLEKYKIKVTENCKVHELIGKNNKEYVDFWYAKYDKAFKGQKLEFEREDLVKGAPIKYRKIYINPIYSNGQVNEISCIAHDITETKIFEQQLQKQSAKLNSIFESSHHYIWTIDSDHKLTSFNKNYQELISNIYNTQPYIGLVLNRGILSNNKEYNEILKHNYENAFSGHPSNFEIETIDKNYNRIYLDIFLNPIFENKKVIEVSGIAHDITERKTAQQRIEQSLKEKEVLLKEVHHRVKNNMQVISSILNLQSSYVTDEYALALLKESQNRIKTMAYIHESLYQNKSFTSVNFSEYVQTLANNIIHSYSVNTEKISLKLNIEKINLSLDNSIPAGLIINELITNAIKHAFKNLSKGVITINLKSKNNTVYLEVKDNGLGFDPSIDYKNTNTLGLQLVNTLADQIGAELNFRSEKGKGTEISIAFKM